MAGIIDYIWQSTFCLFFLYGIYWCFLKDEKAFTLTRIFILIAPVLALLFPIIEIPVDFHKPSISLENTNFYQVLSLQEAPEEIVGAYGLPEVTVSSTRLPLLWEFKDYFIISYFLVVAILSAGLFWQFMQLQMLVRKGWYQTVYQLKDQHFLVPTFGLAPIFSFFDKLFWDDTEVLEPEEKTQIIQHELEHIRQGHSYDVLYFQILSILFWFNPVIHLMRAALVETHEYLADEKVIRQTLNYENYKNLVIRIAFKGLDLPIGNYFIRSTTLKRVIMMKKSPKIKWHKLLMVIPLTGMLLGLVSMKYKQPIVVGAIKNTVSITSLQGQLVKVTDSLQVGIKVKKVHNPTHYEFISPLTDGKLKAQLGELVYEISDITSDEEYIKVMDLLTFLRPNSTITKTYDGIYRPHQVDQKPVVKRGNENWHAYLNANAPMPKKEAEIGLSNPIEVEFIIDIDGNIYNPVIKKSFGGGVDEKFLSALLSKNAPKWVPGRLNGKNVPVVMTTEIMYASNAVGSADNGYFPKSIRIKEERNQTDQPIQSHTYKGEPIFDVVQDPPLPEGGLEAWNKYLSSNLKYPEEAREKNTEGVVYLIFTVTKKGELVSPEILRGIGNGADEEALRVLKNGPKWNPGRQNGESVNVTMRLPVRFKISDSRKPLENRVGTNIGNTLPEVEITSYNISEEKTPFQNKLEEVKTSAEDKIAQIKSFYAFKGFDYYLIKLFKQYNEKGISPLIFSKFFKIS